MVSYPTSKEDEIVKSIFGTIFVIFLMTLLMFRQMAPQNITVIKLDRINDIKLHIKQYPKVLLKGDTLAYHSNCSSKFVNRPDTICQERFLKEQIIGSNIEFLSIRKIDHKTHEGIILRGDFFVNGEKYPMITSQEQIDCTLKLDRNSMIIFRLVIVLLIGFVMIQIYRFSRLNRMYL